MYENLQADSYCNVCYILSGCCNTFCPCNQESSNDDSAPSVDLNLCGTIDGYCASDCKNPDCMIDIPQFCRIAGVFGGGVSCEECLKHGYCGDPIFNFKSDGRITGIELVEQVADGKTITLAKAEKKGNVFTLKFTADEIPANAKRMLLFHHQPSDTSIRIKIYK